MRRVPLPAPLRLAVAWTGACALALVVVAGALYPGNALAAGRPEVSGSARQVDVSGLRAGEPASLISARGLTVSTGRADSLGGLLFRRVSPGTGYRVRVRARGPESGPVTVHSDAAAPWDPRIYFQRIRDRGYQYLRTRDGTTLALTVWPPNTLAGIGAPGVSLLGSGPPVSAPYPTLIEYSGYAYADPSGPVSGIAALANAMGFAVVDVSMRGTGCSGGAFSYFEPLENLDGYDVIETIAHQSWVLDHKVGMMGISYGAISQLFTAQLDPPSLEAIAPLSTLDATATTLYPGGILNTGFAVPWARERQQQAQPVGLGLAGTQPYARVRLAAGDRTCRANQALHGEAAHLMATIRANAHFVPRTANPLDPISFVHRITVPVFLACQWEDEQTGGHCPDLAEHMTGTRQKWFTFTNGAHIDSLDPVTFNRWFDFLQIFVAHRAPALAPRLALVRALAPVLFGRAMGMNDPADVTLPSDPIQGIATLVGARAAFARLPQVTVLFDNGAGRSPNGLSAPGDPYPGFVRGFSRFPIPGTVARRFYLGPGGRLSDRPAAVRGVDTYTSTPGAVPQTDFGANTGPGGLWGNAGQWSWNWRPNPTGTAVSYLSAPLVSDTAVIGSGAVHLWLASSTRDVDLMATVSEVDPNGTETFVQNGWARASERRLATSVQNLLAQPSTLLAPILSERASDARPMPRGRYVEVVIPLYDEGHLYRAGTRIRVTVSAPGGTQPIWAFAHPEPARGRARVSVEFAPGAPSSLILPAVPGVRTSTPVPACGSLRNEPCRAYVPFLNAGT